MKKNLLRTIVLLAVLLTCFASCTESGGENDNNHRHGGGGEANADSIKNACEKFSQVTSMVDSYYSRCKSMNELNEYLPEILEIENVQDAYFSDNYLFISIKDYGTTAYAYFDEEEDDEIGTELNGQIDYLCTRVALDRKYINPDFDLNTAMISNQQHEERMWTRSVAATAVQMLQNAGIDAQYNFRPDIDFFENQIYNYDIIFHIGHGTYDDKTKLHWFLTSQEISTDDELVDLRRKYNTNAVIVCKIDKKNYALISERLIDSSNKNFKNPGKAIFLSVPCQALMGGTKSEWSDNNERDFSFAESLVRKGLGFHLGYDESNGWGQMAGLVFIGKLLSGMTIDNSYMTLPNKYLHDEESERHHWVFSREWTADLLPSYSSTNPFIGSSTLTRPVMGAIVGLDSQKGSQIKLTATAILYNELLIDPSFVSDEYNSAFETSKFKYGFEVSESNDFRNVNYSEMQIGYDDSDKGDKCICSDHIVNYSQTIFTDKLKPETEYFFRAYFCDGTVYNYSEPQSFTTPSRIDQVVPEDIRQTMEPYITIYEGNTPPQVEGVYLMSPKTLTFDYTGQYDVGEKFADHYIKFTNQDYHNNTLDYVGEEVYDGRVLSKSEGPGAFISGTGDNFTVFFNVRGTTYFDDYNVDTTEALIISGTMTSTGIKDAEYSFVLISKSSDPKPHVIDAGDFRVFKDSDGLAETASWPSGTRSTGYRVRNGKITTPWSMYSVRKK